jgi:DNA-binding transcriptional regulator YhcF (GntR family)
MSDSGWIKLHRKILKNCISDRPDYAWLWITLLLLANHDETTFMWNNEKHTLKKGQLITGRKKLAMQTGVTESVIYRALNYLENEQQIKQQKTNKYTVITILNWNRYQDSEQDNAQQKNNKRTTKEQQADTYKNDKNEKNIYTHTYTTLESVNDDLVFQELSDKYNTTIDVVRNAYDNLENYVGSKKNREYANYKKALINFLKGDLERLAKVSSYQGGKNAKPNIVFVNPE